MSPPPPPSTLFPYTTLFRSLPRQLRPKEPTSVSFSAESHCSPADSASCCAGRHCTSATVAEWPARSEIEEHTSELQSRGHLVCRLLLEKNKRVPDTNTISEK